MTRNFFTALILILFLLESCMTDTSWVPMFNGEDLSGWEIKTVPDDAGKNFWTVKDGYIEANSLGQGDHDYIWLYSENVYGDFELKFKFQAFKDSPGNSGIQVRSHYDDQAYWLNGPQIDIHPPGYWRSGMMWDETRGNQRWIFPDIPDGEWVDTTMAISNHEMYFASENLWNDMLVRVHGTSIKAWLNGSKITDFEGRGILDDALHQRLNVGMEGHIAFQIHSGDELKIRFKDIYIRELEN